MIGQGAYDNHQYRRRILQGSYDAWYAYFCTLYDKAFADIVLHVECWDVSLTPAEDFLVLQKNKASILGVRVSDDSPKYGTVSDTEDVFSVGHEFCLRLINILTSNFMPITPERPMAPIVPEAQARASVS